MILPIETDEIDLILLDHLQDDIPLVSNPWARIAEQVGILESDVLKRLQRLADSGVLKGIVPTIESETMGPKVTTLVAFRVPEQNIEMVATVVSQYSEVSHNFRREHEFNLWFTVACPTHERLKAILLEILAITGISPEDMLNLETEKRYKIDVTFPLLDKHEWIRGMSDGS